MQRVHQEHLALSVTYQIRYVASRAPGYFDSGIYELDVIASDGDRKTYGKHIVEVIEVNQIPVINYSDTIYVNTKAVLE